MKIFDFVHNKWVDEDEKKNQYQVSRLDDGTMTIGGGGRNAVPASIWGSDSAYKEAREAIESGKVADFNSEQARRAAQRRLLQPMTRQQAEQTRTAPRVTMDGLMDRLPKAKPAFSWEPEQAALDSQSAYRRMQQQKPKRAVQLPAGPSSYLTGAVPGKEAAPAASAYAAAGSFTNGEIAGLKQARDSRMALAREADALAGTLDIDGLLAKQGPLTDTEKIAANKMLKVLDSQYQPIRIAYQGSPRDGTGARPLPEDVKTMLAKMDALRLKTKGSEAALYGLADSITFGLSNRLEARENNRRLEEYQKKLAAGQALTKAEQADLLMLQSLGGKTSFQTAQEAYPLAYGGAKFGTEAVKYALGGAALDAVSGAGAAMGKAGSWISQKTGGKISAEVAKRLVEGRVQDLPFDIINAAVETDNATDFAKNIGFNQALGLGTDMGVEALAAGWQAIKNAVQDGRLKQFVDPANIQDSGIDAYLEKLHDADGTKVEVLGNIPEQRAMPVLTMERVSAVKVNPGARKSVRELVGEMPMEGYEIPKFHSQSKLFLDGHGQPIPASKYPTAIKKYMMDNFKGKVLSIGSDRVYVNKAGIEEYSFPARRMQDTERLAKFSAGEHLDETLKPARFLLNIDDANGRHPDVIGGWDNYYVMFQVDSDVYSGVVKTKNTAKGRQFYDISEIKKEDVPSATRGVNGQIPLPAMPGTSSDFNVAQSGAKFNGQTDANLGGKFDFMSAHENILNEAQARREQALTMMMPEKPGAADGFELNAMGMAGDALSSQNPFGDYDAVSLWLKPMNDRQMYLETTDPFLKTLRDIREKMMNAGESPQEIEVPKLAGDLSISKEPVTPERLDLLQEIAKEKGNFSGFEEKNIDKAAQNDILKEISMEPIQITEEAVEAVPRVTLPRFTEEQAGILQEHAKSLLRYVADSKPETEAVLYLDMDLKPYRRYKDDGLRG